MNYDIVVGGGGYDAITTIAKIAPLWPRTSPAVVIAIEMTGRPPASVLQILDSYSPIPVAYAVHGEPLLYGRSYLCPPGKHIVVGPDKVVQLEDVHPFDLANPSLNRLFASAAAVYGQRAIAVLLGANPQDGRLGLLDIHAAGGVCIVQVPDDASEPSMPDGDDPNYRVKAADIGPLVHTLTHAARSS